MGIIQLSIELNAWDCFLYSGILFVVTLNNEINGYDWERILKSVDDPHSHAALYSGLSRADYAQSGNWLHAMTHEQFFDTLKQSVRASSSKTFEVDADTLEQHKLFSIPNPLGTISSAFTIYKNMIYVSSSMGLFSIRIPKDKKSSRNQKAEKVWEGRAVALAGGGISSVAIAAGSDGTFRYRADADHYEDAKEVHQFSEHHTTNIDWTHISLFRTSLQCPGELLTFERVKPQSNKSSQPNVPDKFLAAVTFAEQEFDYSWASKHNIFGLRNNQLSIYTWSEKAIRNSAETHEGQLSKSLKNVRHINLQAWKGRVLSAATTVFGTVIECENALLVADMNSRIWTVPHEVSRWRTYGRSTYYFNQLHLITEGNLIALGYTDPIFTNAGVQPPRPTDRLQ